MSALGRERSSPRGLSGGSKSSGSCVDGSRCTRGSVFPEMAARGGRWLGRCQLPCSGGARPSTVVGHPPGATTALVGAAWTPPPPPTPPPPLPLSRAQFISEFFCRPSLWLLNLVEGRGVRGEGLGVHLGGGKRCRGRALGVLI